MDGEDTRRGDEELRRSSVGGINPINAPIVLVEYDPRWPDLFVREARRARAILGGTALRVEHVGSTSVPGLVANLHVFTDGAIEIGRMLAFRDRLRGYAADRELYARAKRDLAARTWRHVQHYADAKTSVITEIPRRGDHSS